jgi:WD40 repeat protein
MKMDCRLRGACLHQGGVTSASFSPDGQQIVTASDDGSAKVWDVNGNQLMSFDGHTDDVDSASFSPDGTKIVTASRNGSAKLWAFPPWQSLVTAARARLARGFSNDECRRFFREDLDSCPQTVEEVFALFEDDLQEP